MNSRETGQASWICAQIGAREHYAVPRALSRVCRLNALYTDFWAGESWRRFAGWGNGVLRSLATRYHTELKSAAVMSLNLRFLFWEANSRRRAVRENAAGLYQNYLDIGRSFAEAVRDSLRRRRNIPSRTIFFAYDTGALEVMEWLRERGVYCVLDQMDPSRVEVDLVREEEKSWPGWQDNFTEVPEEYFRRREEEWSLADRIVVNSEFCRRALIQQGVAPDKLTVIPLSFEKSFETGGSSSPPFGRSQDNLRILWLGQVNLRKGIPYLLEAARLLSSERVHFDVVGPIAISRDAVASAPANVTFHGRVERDRIGEWYRRADLFVLPTISDGFALTQLEAMAYGLPVIATPNCGDVVHHELDGLIVPPRDAAALARAIHRYLQDPFFLRAHRAAAPINAQRYSLNSLAGKLTRLESLFCDGSR
ncbi:MAG: glycosyltransferase family 4 protein [Blastocatellia bacterium]|nr:glycosyltransferase family 4 protein [Blastocatellia bacterium]